MAKYRQGYKLAMSVPKAKQRLLSLGFKPYCGYEWNQQGGKMFSMPKDIPRAFDDEQAGWVCRECYLCRKPKLSKSQMESVRAMLSYAYQLKTGEHATVKTKANFPSVRDQFGCQNDYAPPKQALKAKYILRRASWSQEGLHHRVQPRHPEAALPGMVRRRSHQLGLERLRS